MFEFDFLINQRGNEVFNIFRKLFDEFLIEIK